MGSFFWWFQKNNVAELQKDIEKLEAKKAKINAEIKAIKDKVKELESKN